MDWQRQTTKQDIDEELATVPVPNDASNTVDIVAQDGAASGPSVTQPALPATSRSSRWRLSRKQWVMAGGVCLIVAACGGAYFLTRPDAASTASNTQQSSQSKASRLGIAPTLQDGAVEFSTDGTMWQTLTDKVNLQEGDQVRTGSDGRVVLTLDDGSAVRLGYSSSVQLESLAATDVRIVNLSGELYSRVIPSQSHTYTVMVDKTAMVAKGTAFRTMSTADSKGVEVFQSTVSVKDTDVSEGKAYFTKHADAAKTGAVSDIDLNSLKNDEFIKWNAGLDKEINEAKDKLGVLVDIDKPAEAQKPAETPSTSKPSTSDQQNGIVLSGKLSDYTGKFTWKVTGVDTSNGFKLVRSTSTQKPVYPGDDYRYFSDPAARSAVWDMDGGKTYYVRICAYRGGSCDSYSKTVTLTTPAKQDDSPSSDELQPGSVSLTLSGTALSWSITGTAPYGFKVVAATHANPEYPTDGYKYYGYDKSYDLSAAGLESGKTYYVRVCKYTGGGCTDYSNQVTYTKP